MKRIISVFLFLVLFTTFFGCTSKYMGWKEIEIKSGTIKVPEQWSVSYNNDLVYFFLGSPDKKDDVYIFQSNSFSEFKNNSDYAQGDVEPNIFSNKFQNLYTISSHVNSNGAIYGEAMVSDNDKKFKMKFLILESETNEVQLFVRNDKVSNETFMKIIESFKSGA